MNRLICWLLGHADTVIRWGPWVTHPEAGSRRLLTEECTRCRGVLRLAAIVNGQWWTP